MKESAYIGREEYVDAPAIYGQHARYWASLDPLSKIATIRRVGLFGFLREVHGYADAERIRERLEEECATLIEECSAAKKHVHDLQQKNQELEEKLTKTFEALKVAEKNNGRWNHRLLTPPSATSIMNAFNRMCPERVQWFFNPHEDTHTGVVTFSHNFMFYPFSEINVPRGRLRLCDQYGDPVCLTQCHSYAALPAKLAQHLIPADFHTCRMRVLFVTNEKGLWLADPLFAQDILLEIWAHFDWGNPSKERIRRHREAIELWEKSYHDTKFMACGTDAETRFYMIASFEELLGRGQNNFSKEQIERIRNKCYTEYLSIYFKDQYDEE